MSWHQKQIEYWDSISFTYDLLYQNRWSELENEQTRQILSKVVPKDANVIVDLGCGTGLGYELLLQCISNFQYTGVDISSRMLERFREKHSCNNVRLDRRCISNLDFIADNSVDFLISLFTSLSFSPSIQDSFAEIHRVLRQGGVYFVSVLSRRSLRRLLHNKFDKIELFRTRNDSSRIHTVPAYTYTPNELRNISSVSGLAISDLYGQSCFGGVSEYPILWQLDVFISRLVPTHSHSLSLLGYKPIRG